MVRLFLVHKLSIVNRDPDEIKAIYIHMLDNPQSVLSRRWWMIFDPVPSTYFRPPLAIIPQHVIMVRLFLVHKLSIVNRDPDEIKAIYIHMLDNPQSVSRQSSGNKLLLFLYSKKVASQTSQITGQYLY